MRLLQSIRRVGQLFQQYVRLPRPYRVAIRRATYWIVTIRTALACLPFKQVLHYVERRAQSALQRDPSARDAATDPSSRSDTALHRASTASRPTLWAVHAVGRRLMPARPCLTQALVGRLLLAREGVDVTLHIGVAKSDGELRAHAWLEQDGVIILGGAQSRDEYRPFPALNG